MNVVATTPGLIVAGSGVVALLAGLLPDRRARRLGPGLVALTGIVAAFVMVVLLWGDREQAYAGNLYSDRFSLLLTVTFLIAALATIGLAWREPAAVDRQAEVHGLLMLAVSGMILVAAAGNLIVLFLGVELLSVPLYVLCALETSRTRSLESGLKYLVTGALGSGILLYGLAFLYGATGTTSLAAINAKLVMSHLGSEPLLIVAVAMIVAGLGFKATAVPFHMWAPDVYEGAPTPVTAFMATAVKAAALAAFLKILGSALLDLQPGWETLVAALAATTVIVGNVGALLQTNMKRLLAYSGVAQAGYLLIGVAAGTLRGTEAIAYYLLAYLAMTMAAFAIVVIRERETEDGDELRSLAGYGRQRPVLGIVMTVSMLSLAGFPPLAGFVGKFLLFGSAIDRGMWWLAVVGVAGSLISLGYYLRVLGVMWLSDADTSRPRRVLPVPGGMGAVAVGGAAAVIGLALAASPVLDLCRGAAEALLTP